VSVLILQLFESKMYQSGDIAVRDLLINPLARLLGAYSSLL
jgi:hypothetical protein